jgi:hypothetical protein
VPYLQQWYGLQSTTSRNYSNNFRVRAATHLLAQHLHETNTTSSSSCMYIFNDAGKKQSLDDLLAGQDKEVWTKSQQ